MYQQFSQRLDQDVRLVVLVHQHADRARWHMSFVEHQISDRINASVESVVVPAFAFVVTSAQVEDVHKTLEIVVDVMAVILAPHRQAVQPARPHLNGAERVEGDPNRENVHAFPAAMVGFVIECRVRYHSGSESTTVQQVPVYKHRLYVYTATPEQHELAQSTVSKLDFDVSCGKRSG